MGNSNGGEGSEVKEGESSDFSMNFFSLSA